MSRKNTFSVSEINKITAYYPLKRHYDKDKERIESNLLMERAKSIHLNNKQYQLQKQQNQSLQFDNNNNNNNNNNTHQWRFGMHPSYPIIPITCKQAHDALNENVSLKNEIFIIDGEPVHNISIIGQLYKKCKRYNHQQWWTICDGTNKVEILFNTNINMEEWKNDKSEKILHGKNNSTQKKDTRNWYKIYATINYHSQPKGQFVLQGFQQSIIEDKNEISMHFLECIHAHLYHVKCVKNA